ncbi:MAG TPA: pyridoxamine 5'-phosphate oxidase family protein [Candidatus Dormibacteraeota bacterium]|jgi:pyridoxamine 5'-phosphate oxidase family protein
MVLPMMFSDAELEFLRSQRIGRFATVGKTGWPHVVPVMYAVDDSGALEFDVDGIKLRNIQAEPRAAMVVDAMGPKRGVSIQGHARLIGPERARLEPVRKFSWGL